METKIFLYKGNNLDIIKDKLKRKPNVVYMDPPYNTWNESLLYGDKVSTIEWADNFNNLITLLKGKTQDDCVFFVSINDEELANVILTFKNVLGKNSIISIMPRRTHSGHKTTKTISNSHDFVVIAKKGNVNFSGIDIDSPDYKHEDMHLEKRGKYQLRRIDYKDFRYSKSLDYNMKIDGINYYPGAVTKKEHDNRKENHSDRDWAWIWCKDKMDFALANDYIVAKDGKLFKKTYTKSELIRESKGKYKIVYKTRQKKIDSLHFTDKKFSLKKTKTHPEEFFDYPKSDELIWEILKLPEFDKKIVLDPFGGTGTTAIMAHKLNLQEAHIIQISEKTDNKSLAYKNGYKDIYNLTKQNIKSRTKTKNMEEIK